MRLLHTSDWHVGKTIRGHSRAPEHEAVLDEIVALADDRAVDCVLVAGDLWESATPTPDAERLVYRTLLRLAETGATVVVIAGNHDHARRLDAIAPVFDAAGRGAEVDPSAARRPGSIRVVARPRRPDDGGVQHLRTRSGEDLRVACLPFVSQRGIVRATDLMDNAAFEHTQAYQARMAALIDTLCAGFSPDTVNVVLAHAFVIGGELGGGERSAHVIDDYALSAQVFPISASYIALGHVHRAQRIAAGSPVHYCGSPLHLDFGERPEQKQLNLVEVEAGTPAEVTPLGLTSGRELLTLRGTVAELEHRLRTGEVDPTAWLRVQVDEPARVGLADEIRSLFGERAVDVRVLATDHGRRPERRRRRGRSPHELFSEFLAERGVADERLERRFAELLEAELDSDEGSNSPSELVGPNDVGPESDGQLGLL